MSNILNVIIAKAVNDSISDTLFMSNESMTELLSDPKAKGFVEINSLGFVKFFGLDIVVDKTLGPDEFRIGVR